MEIGREFHMNSIKRKFQSFHSVNIVEGTERERKPFPIHKNQEIGRENNSSGGMK